MLHSSCSPDRCRCGSGPPPAPTKGWKVTPYSPQVSLKVRGKVVPPEKSVPAGGLVISTCDIICQKAWDGKAAVTLQGKESTQCHKCHFGQAPQHFSTNFRRWVQSNMLDAPDSSRALHVPLNITNHAAPKTGSWYSW